MGLVEIAALLFGWYTLWRIEILDVRRELEPLLCAALGLALGFVANNVGLAALRAL